MTYNLIYAAKEMFNEAFLSEAAFQLDEDQKHISKAMDGILPTVFGKLTDMASSKKGAKTMLKIVNNFENPSEISNPESFAVKKLSHTYYHNPKHTVALFGSKIDIVTSYVSGHSGLRSRSVSFLLEITLISVIELIREHTDNIKMDIASLHFILFSQKKKVISTIKDGFKIEELLGGIWNLPEHERSQLQFNELKHKNTRLTNTNNQSKFKLVTMVLLVIISLLFSVLYFVNPEVATGNNKLSLLTSQLKVEDSRQGR